MRPLHPRAVIDTNVLLDFWVFDDAASRPLRAAVEVDPRAAGVVPSTKGSL